MDQENTDELFEEKIAPSSGFNYSDEHSLALIQHLQSRKECFAEIARTPKYLESDLCPQVWDQLLCWPSTSPGSWVSLPCSQAFPFDGPGFAKRYCLPNGLWANEDHTGSPEGWSDYTNCLNPPDHVLIMKWVPPIKKISVIGYTISLVTLVIAFIILFSLRRLKCPRNVIHLNLFASFIMRSLVLLIKYFFLTEEKTLVPTSLPEHAGDPLPGTWWCKLLIAFWQYFIMANYSWILMEGLFLHNLVFLNSLRRKRDYKMYVAIGWGIPSLFISSWALLKHFFDDLQCWTINHVKWIFWVCIRFPIATSNFINFFFFLKISHALLTKIRFSEKSESLRIRKMAKATLILVPLFGVHYFLLWGLSVIPDIQVELVWLGIDQIFSSFQGLFVALFFCLLNGEVRQELKRMRKGFRRSSYSTLFSSSRYSSRRMQSGNDVENRKINEFSRISRAGSHFMEESPIMSR